MIHTVGPVWDGGQNGEDELLAACYRASLALADEHGLQTVAFPAISTGVYRFPPKPRATSIALATTLAWLEGHAMPERVVFCCFSDRDAELYRAAINHSPKADGG